MTDTVRRRGTDPSGRPILASDYLWDWWERVVDELGWRPEIMQGSYMSRVPGGGASASAGYHDQGGTFDLRTRDLTPAQSDQLVRTLRRFGAAAWRRDWTHGGMAPHLHFVLGADKPLSPGAYIQWRDYQLGYDGLASRGKDPEWRPDPLVLVPPEEDMPLSDEDAAKVAKALLDGQFVTLRKADGTTKEIPVRNALERILNPDES